MSRVGLVTCAAFPNLYQDDHLLRDALATIGIEPIPVVWSDARVEWSAFDALVIRSPWDYFERWGEFRRWLSARVASDVPLMNAGEILEWNSDKRYLRQLESAGVALVPTEYVERGSRSDVTALVRARGWNEVVLKPSVSGGAYRTYRTHVDSVGDLTQEIAAILSDRDLLVQPFLPEIFEGELSLLFLDAEFSHAVRKCPKPGEFRVQFQFGGTHECIDVSPSLVEQARACVLAAPSRPVYARVDGVIQDGRFLLMELEVFEPLMFLGEHPDAPMRFARAIAARL